jgi:hypothetical protein
MQRPARFAMTGPVVLVLAEQDYLYGAGRLRIRVDQVDALHPVHYDGEDWYPITGVLLSRDNVELHPAQVLVRARRLPAALLT